MDTIEPNEENRQIWQQPGSHPGTAAADLRASLGASGEPPWGLFLQQEALLAWAGKNQRLISRKDIRLASQSPGIEHEVIFDSARQRFIKITQPGSYGHTGSCRWGKLELIQAKPLEYFDRLAMVDDLFADGTTILGAITHAAGPRIVTAQPLVVGVRPSREQIIQWLRGPGFVPVGPKTYWHDGERLALFDAHPGNVLQIPSGQLCPIDIIPVKADREMTAFMRSRVKR